MASRYRDAKRGHSRTSGSALVRGSAHIPSYHRIRGSRQNKRDTLPRVERSRTPRPMHSLQTMQGLEPSKINRDSRTLGKGASAPFLLRCIIDSNNMGPQTRRAAEPQTKKLGRRAQSRRVSGQKSGPQTLEQRRRALEPRTNGSRQPFFHKLGALTPLK